MNLREMLDDMVKRGSTDIILSANHVPMCRIGGRLVPYGQEVFKPELIRKMVCDVMLDEAQRARFEQAGETDVTVNLAGVGLIGEQVAIARANDPGAMTGARRAETDLAALEKQLYDQEPGKRQGAELALKKLAAAGNRGATEILEQFGRFYQTNFEERKIGLRR